MARHFDISIPNDAAAVDAGATTRVAFTVTNTSQLPQRATLRLKPIDATQANWLAINGDVERDFPPGFTHQVEGTVKVPVDAKPGSYRLRLDAVSTSNADDFTEGSAVIVTVKGAVGTPPPPPPSRWWIWLIIGMVLLVVIGVVAWLVLRDTKKEDLPPPKPPASAVSEVKDVVVPNGLNGQPFDTVKKQLEALGLTVSRENRGINDDCPDKVLGSNPTPGVTIRTGSPIMLTVGVLKDGPPTCKPGFVFRGAFGGDTVCVTEASKQRAQFDNAAMKDRTETVQPTSKDFERIQRENPKAAAVAKGDLQAFMRVEPRFSYNIVGVLVLTRCKFGFTERRASADDHVCVTEATYRATAEENQQVETNKACPRK